MAQIAQIPFGPQQADGLDVLGGAQALAVNVVTDPLGSVRRRPGVRAASWLHNAPFGGAPCIGLFVTSEGETIAATGEPPGDVRVWRVSPYGAADLEATPAAHVTASGRLEFAETEAMVVFATGRAIHKVEKFGWKMARLGGGAPLASHVVAQGARLLANDMSGDRTKVHYSAPTLGKYATVGHEQWGAKITAIGKSGYFTAEGRPDPVVALAENSNEVFVFGASTLQVFAPDTSLVYAPVATREFGCLAPHGVVKIDQDFAWVDHRRRIVRSDGRTLEVLSDPIQGDLDVAARIDDAFGFRAKVGYADLHGWSLPTDRRTFVMQAGVGWGQWATWEDGRLGPCPIRATAFDATRGVTVAATDRGTLGVMDADAQTDLGLPIPVRVETGFIGHGTDARKHCRALRLVLRRENVAGSGTAMIRWRDDEGAWGSPIEFSIPDAEDPPVVTFRSLGVYRRRQWRLDCHSDAPFILTRATEEFDVLAD